MNKNFFKKLLAAALIVAMAIPAIYLGGAKEEVTAANAQTDLLQVVAQTTQQKVVGGTYDGKYVLRFTSTVSEDELNTADSVGFEVTVDGKTYRSATTSVFTRIDANEAETAFTYSPKVVDVDSAYFFTAKWAVEELDAAKLYTVRAFAKNKADGSYVYGPERMISVNDGLVSGTTALVAFPVETEVTTAYVNGAEVVVAGQGNGYAHVRVPKAGLQSVNNLTLTAEAGGEPIATTTYRYFGNTAYTAADTSWHGTEAEDYVLATVNDLFGFASLVENGTTFEGKNVYVVSDLVVNQGAPKMTYVEKSSATMEWYNGETPVDTADLIPWNPIGVDGSKGFKGTFDGQGHDISGVYCDKAISAGFFEFAVYPAVIKNFAFTDSYIRTQNGWVGGVVGVGEGCNVEAVYCDAVVASNGKRVGGIIGEYYYSTTETGIVPAIKDCWYAGELVLQGSANEMIGGIVGRIYMTGGAATTAEEVMEVKNCLFTGHIQSAATSIGAQGYIGGISGGISDTASKATLTVKFQNCVSAGTYHCNNNSSTVFYGYNNTATKIQLIDSFAYRPGSANGSLEHGIIGAYSKNSQAIGLTELFNYDREESEMWAAVAAVEGMFVKSGVWAAYGDIYIPASLINVVK